MFAGICASAMMKPSTVVFVEEFAGGLAGYEYFDAPTTSGGGSISDFSITSDGLRVGTGPASTHTAIRKALPKITELRSCSFTVKLLSSGVDDCGIISFRDSASNAVFIFGIRRDSAIDSQRRPDVSFIDMGGSSGILLGPSGGVSIGVWYRVYVEYLRDTGKFSVTMTNVSTSAIYASAEITISERLPIAFLCFENDNFYGAGTCAFGDVVMVLG